MKIKGKVFQIIKSDKKEDFILPRYLYDEELKDYDIIQISTNDNMKLEEYKRGYRILYNSIFLSWIPKIIDGSKRPKIEVVLIKNNNFNLGQDVEIEVEKFFKPTNIFIKSEFIPNE